MREKYESLSLATLKDLAKARGLKGVSTLRKPELIERMLQEDQLENEENNKKAEKKEPDKKAEEEEHKKAENDLPTQGPAGRPGAEELWRLRYY